MRRVDLLLKFVSYGALWGVVLGGALSLPFLLIMFQFQLEVFLSPTICCYSIAIGAICGSVLGAFDGLILGVLSVVFFYDCGAERTYRVSMMITALIATFVSSAIVFDAVISFFSYRSKADPTSVLSAAAIATSGAGYACHVVSLWYLDKRGDRLAQVKATDKFPQVNPPNSST